MLFAQHSTLFLMRKRFEQQNQLDAELIPEVKIDGKSRHELPQLLAGLQYIFVTPDLNAPEKAQNERITELIARFAPASPLREAVCVSLEARRRQKMAKTGVFGQTLFKLIINALKRIIHTFDPPPFNV